MAQSLNDSIALRVGVLDIGSNSVRLLIADRRRGRLTTVASHGVTTRLAGGFEQREAFAPRAVAKTVAAARSLVEEARRQRVSRIRAVATGVLRASTDNHNVLDLIEAATAARVEVLSGREEGRLCLLGAWSLVASGSERARLVDVGGGSTEVVHGTPWKVEAAASVPLGCVRVAERFLRSDPPSSAELAAAHAEVARHVAALDLGPTSGAVIATGGTATSLASLQLSLLRYAPDRVQGHRLHREQLESLTTSLASMPLARRRRLRGLSPDRADIIVAGAVILSGVLECWGAGGCLVSDRGLRHGIALELMGLAG
jgi:exopolyphosphatase/guanosine-5'-triphosphate,3'-diphosphate pyrophosphatase